MHLSCQSDNSDSNWSQNLSGTPVLAVTSSILFHLNLTLCIHVQLQQNVKFFRSLSVYSIHLMFSLPFYSLSHLLPSPLLKTILHCVRHSYCLFVQLNHFSHFSTLNSFSVSSHPPPFLPLPMRRSPCFFSEESKGLWALCFSITQRVRGAGRGFTERNGENASCLLVSLCPLREAVQVKQRRLFLFSACGWLWFSLPWDYRAWT